MSATNEMTTVRLVGLREAETPRFASTEEPFDVLARIEPGEIHARAEEVLDRLPDDERYVVRRYYGFDDEPVTLATIAKELGVTESRISHLKTQAVETLGLILVEGADPGPVNRFEKYRKPTSEKQRPALAAEIEHRLGDLHDPVLTVEETEAILGNFPGWHRAVYPNRSHVVLCRRRQPGELMPKSGRAGKGKGVVRRGDEPIIRVQGDALADHLITALRLERRIDEANDTWPRNVLSRRQRQVLNKLHLAIATIASELGLGEESIKTHLSNAGKRLEINNGIELAVLAGREQLLDLRDVPAGRTARLTDRERELLTKCYAMTHKDAAAELKIGQTTVRSYFHNALKKTGASSRRELALMALRDGLIPEKSGR